MDVFPALYRSGRLTDGLPIFDDQSLFGQIYQGELMTCRYLLAGQQTAIFQTKGGASRNADQRHGDIILR